MNIKKQQTDKIDNPTEKEEENKLLNMDIKEIKAMVNSAIEKKYTTPPTTLEEAEERAGSKVELTKDGLIKKHSDIKKYDAYTKLLDFVLPLSIIGITIASYFLIHISTSVFWNIIFSLVIGIVSGIIFSVIICDILFRIFASKEAKEKEKKNNEKLAIINTLEKKLLLVKLPYHRPIDYYDSPMTRFIGKHTLERCPKCGHQLTFLNSETRGSEGKTEIGAYNYTYFTPDKIGERRKTEYRCSKCKMPITELRTDRQVIKKEKFTDYDLEKLYSEVEIKYSTSENESDSIKNFLRRFSGKAMFDNKEENKHFEKEEKRKIKSGEDW